MLYRFEPRDEGTVAFEASDTRSKGKRHPVAGHLCLRHASVAEMHARRCCSTCRIVC